MPRRRVPAIERVMIAVMIRFALRFDNETETGSGIRTALRTETLLPKSQTQPDPACPTSCALTTVSTFSSGKTSLFMTIVNNRRFHWSEAFRPGPNGDSIGTADADRRPVRGHVAPLAHDADAARPKSARLAKTPRGSARATQSLPIQFRFLSVKHLLTADQQDLASIAVIV